MRRSLIAGLIAITASSAGAQQVESTHVGSSSSWAPPIWVVNQGSTLPNNYVIVTCPNYYTNIDGMICITETNKTEPPEVLTGDDLTVTTGDPQQVPPFVCWGATSTAGNCQLRQTVGFDVCTLVAPQTVTLRACAPETRCEGANGKVYCQSFTKDCNHREPYYECKRPDGTAYTAPWTEHPAFNVPN
jgi:hypothetical protein